MRGCVVCGEELTVEEWKHFNSGLGTIEPWCFPCFEDESQRMVNEEHMGNCRYRTLPRYLVLKEEWEA